MKNKYKYLAHTGLCAVLCLLLILPAYSQHGGGSHGGGGGGRGGGGGGGFSGGHSGGFSGGHFGGGFSGDRSRGGFSGGRGFSGPQRGNFAPRGGFKQSLSTGFRGNTRSLVNGGRSYGGYGRGAHEHGTFGHGDYGHGGYGHGGRGRPYGWGRHGGYFYSQGYYGSLYYPYIGTDLGYLPYGDYPFFWDDNEYYLSNGLYYQYDNDQYTVVEPPVGAAVQTLPSGAQSIMIDGQQCYELDGVYYAPVTDSDGTTQYTIAGKDGTLNTDADGAQTVVPKVGNLVATLPPDCRKVTLNGRTLFVSEDGIYYQETTDSNNAKVYKIVAVESDFTDS